MWWDQPLTKEHPHERQLLSKDSSFTYRVFFHARKKKNPLNPLHTPLPLYPPPVVSVASSSSFFLTINFALSSANAVLRVPILYGQVEKLDESAVTVLFPKVKNTSETCVMSDYERRYPTHCDDIAFVLRQLAEKKVEVRTQDFGDKWNVLVAHKGVNLTDKMSSSITERGSPLSFSVRELYSSVSISLFSQAGLFLVCLNCIAYRL